MELSASMGSSDIEEYGVEMCAWLCLRRWARLDINPEVARYGGGSKSFWNSVPLYAISLLVLMLARPAEPQPSTPTDTNKGG